MGKQFITIILLFSTATMARAQEKIIFKSGEILNVKILETSKELVKFKKLDDDVNIYITDMSEIREIIEQSNSNFLFVETHKLFRKSALNFGSFYFFDFFGLVQYERMMKPS